jgi:hypothetical protein
VTGLSEFDSANFSHVGFETPAAAAAAVVDSNPWSIRPPELYVYEHCKCWQAANINGKRWWQN